MSSTTSKSAGGDKPTSSKTPESAPAAPSPSEEASPTTPSSTPPAPDAAASETKAVAKSATASQLSSSSSSQDTAASGSSAMTSASAGTASSSGSSDPKARGWPKGKKRYPKMPGAPKQPLSGYVHFLNDRREDLRKECPDISFAEISKKLANEWSVLDPDTKQRYVERAEEDKERYAKEFAEYRLTDGYKKYVEEQEKKQLEKNKKGDKDGQQQQQQQQPKKKAKKAAAAAGKAGSSSSAPVAVEVKVKKEEPEEEVTTFPSGSGADLPLFTDEFLEFNKGREAELRQLRKQVAEMEEQNAVLAKHVENMQSATGKLEAETAQQEENTAALNSHLDRLRRAVVSAFAGVKMGGFLSGGGDAVTMDNVDEFMAALQGRLDGGGSEAADDPALVLAKNTVAKIDYSQLRDN